jgi:hypothetical protein
MRYIYIYVYTVNRLDLWLIYVLCILYMVDNVIANQIRSTIDLDLNLPFRGCLRGYTHRKNIKPCQVCILCLFDEPQEVGVCY